MIEKQTQLNAYWHLRIQVVNFDSNDLKNLTDFYLPMVGTDAFAAYLALQNFDDFNDQLNELLDLLNISLLAFDDARKKLEATGLLNSYLSAGNLLFVIKKPLAKEIFFADDLLSSFFFSVAGKARFQKLSMQLQKEAMPLSAVKMNANFYEAFGNINLKRPDVATASLSAKKLRKPLIEENKDTFNFDLVAASLKKYGVSPDEVAKEHNFILSQHLIYGFSEEKMIDLLASALLIDKKTVDHTLFRQQLEKLALKLPESDSVPVSAAVVQGHEQVKLNRDERQLVQAAKGLPPFQFLAQLKKMRGGIVTSAEQKNIDHLVDLGLKPEVINILIHQILVGMESTNLPAALSQAIADSFLQSHVQNAGEAILSVKSRQEKQSEKRYSKYKLVQKEKKIDYGSAKKTDNQLALDALAKYQREKKPS
ncbi:helicase DnaB [Oenococcus sicerae]|uniref:Helicase DnaB n=1 Tax=Oenococcus sicerae TaxID=2203724 RepID=A0ABX5QMZ2_9LACO|nr:DnaD domain protein [Oenococcus sicerae]QAS70115.1 helicase DnaB [Oenococcus sicerae]VDK13686.1 hypothetical protein OAL24_00481 [Oenococcus sicerae]